MVFGGFAWFLQWFRALDHQNHCKNQEKTTNSWILKNNLKMVVFLFFFLVFTVVLVVCCGCLMVFRKFYNRFDG